MANGDRDRCAAPHTAAQPGLSVLETALTLACGRLLRLLSRPQQPGDVEAYYAARAAALDAAERLGLNRARYEPNYARDRHSGAAGD